MRILLVVITLISISYGDDWLQWRGSQGNGISTETNTIGTWPVKGLKKLWKFPLGEGLSGIAISGTTAITMYGDAPGGKKKQKPTTPQQKKSYNGYNFDVPIHKQEQNKYEYVVALNTETGKKIWQTKINDLYYNQMGNGPRATPTIDGDRVYTVSGKGNLSCLSINNGNLIWQMNIFQKFKSDNLLFGISSSPIIYKKWLIYQVGKGTTSIVAFDKKTGSVAWQLPGQGPSYATPVVTNLFEQPQILFFNQEGIVGINPETQKYVWRYPWTTFQQIHAATPIIYKNYVFISSGYQTGAGLIKLQKNNHEITPQLSWKNSHMKNHFSSSLLLGEYIYGFHNRIFKCMHVLTGEEKWQARGFSKGSVIALNNNLIVLGESGNLALIEANPHKYVLKQQFNPFDRKTTCWTTPSIANGKLFIRDKKELLCFSLRK